jgi:pimeloyl-ACP methyl ester carboxylesterase
MAQAKRVREDFEDEKWIIGGHSLGAVVASFAIADAHLDEYEGLFLMGSYASTDISGWDQPVFSILAENDGLTDMASVEENAVNLPEGINAALSDLPDLGDTHGKTVYYTINGGNHAQFGSYGIQKGDGTANISSADQQREFFEVLTILMRNNDFDL